MNSRIPADGGTGHSHARQRPGAWAVNAPRRARAWRMSARISSAPNVPCPRGENSSRSSGTCWSILLLIATAISFALWLYERDAALPYEAIAISAVVLLNAVLGYVQQERAESAIAALRQMAAAHALVIRDGEPTSVLAAEVVPGDVLIVEEGDTVPADARVIESTALQVAEAALTGESLPVSKDIGAIAGEVGLGDRTNMIYSGTSVTYGRGRAVVIATGMQTEMGHIAGMLSRVGERTHSTPKGARSRRQAARRGGHSHRRRDDCDDRRRGTRPRSVGASRRADPRRGACGGRRARRACPRLSPPCCRWASSGWRGGNAIVRHLSAVETLGSASVIASDKTGTLTRNEMTVREVVTASGHVTIAGRAMRRAVM